MNAVNAGIPAAASIAAATRAGDSIVARRVTVYAAVTHAAGYTATIAAAG